MLPPKLKARDIVYARIAKHIPDANMNCMDDLVDKYIEEE